MLPLRRGAEIVGRLKSAFAREELNVTFQPSPATESIAYFPDDLGDYVASLSDARTSFAVGRPLAETDILIVTMHGGAETTRLWELRRDGFAGIVAGWFWDNHMARLKNLSAALACDVVFAAHRYVALALRNPLSILARHVPSCAAQFAPGFAARLFDDAASRPRSDRLYCGYLATGLARDRLLTQLAAEMAEADVLMMPMADRSRFFGKTREERFGEWLGYKTSLVLPLDEDLSTRVFDGLLAGHVILVPRNVRDLDRVIPPPDQALLGIARFDEHSVAAVRAAHGEALARYDRAGPAGARLRHGYVLSRHMLGHRLLEMRDSLAAIAAGTDKVVFRNPQGRQPGLCIDGEW